jgi:hypothetical protein
MRSRKLTAGIAAAAVAATPVAVALAATPEPAAPIGVGLGSQFNGHPTAGSELRTAAAGQRAAHARAERRRAAARERAQQRELARVPAVLKTIAQCESGGDPRAIGGGGAYRGLLQFDRGTWASVGGQGDPIDASPAEQYKRGAILYARSGPGQWPVCGR